MKVRFYSRAQCELCVEGLALLKLVQEDVPFDFEVVDIEKDDAAHERFMLMIPVVEVAGQIVQYGHLDYVTLLEGLSEAASNAM